MTRRGLVAAAALLAGCGAADDGEPGRAAEEAGGTSSLADAALLNDALAAERRVLERLEAAHGVPAAVVRRGRAHLDLIERAIRRAHGRVQPLDPGPAAPDPVVAQDELVALYVDQLPKLSEPRLRGEVAGLLADAALAGAELRLARGEEPAPEALFAGARPEERGA